jgi:hypothetical protein
MDVLSISDRLTRRRDLPTAERAVGGLPEKRPSAVSDDAVDPRRTELPGQPGQDGAAFPFFSAQSAGLTELRELDP